MSPPTPIVQAREADLRRDLHRIVAELERRRAITRVEVDLLPPSGAPRRVTFTGWVDGFLEEPGVYAVRER